MKRIVMIILIFSFIGIIYADDSITQRIFSIYSEEEALPLIKELGNSNDKDKDLYMGILYHNLATNPTNTVKYYKKAINLLENYYNKNNNNNLAKGYYGSSITLEASIASDKGDFMKALADLSKGNKIIDEAVKSESDNIPLRIMRANNAISTSDGSPINRYNIAKKDLEYIFTKSDKLDNETISMCYYLYGIIYYKEKKLVKAIECFNNSVKAAPDSEYAAKSKKYLMELSE